MFFTAVITVLIFVIRTTLPQNVDHHYDVTTLVKLDEGQEKTIVVARGNARGLPLRKSLSFLNGTYGGQRCCQDWTREGWVKLNSEAALSWNPLLDPGPTSSFDGTTHEADRFDRLATTFLGFRQMYWEWDSNSNSADLPVDGRIRLSFRLSAQTSTLRLYLCDTQDASNIECVAFLLSGYDPSRSFLRYQALHLSGSGTGPPIATPFGKLKSTILHKNESAPQTWKTDVMYNFLVERSYEGNFEVRLDGSDFQQKRLMTVKATQKMRKFAVIATPFDSSTYLQVIDDPTWYGYLYPGGQMWVEFKPPEIELDQQLGVFLCADRFQENCIGEVISGVSANGIRYFAGNYSQNERSDMKYWVAGSEEKTYSGTEIGRNENVQAHWDKILKTRSKNVHIFSVSRHSNGSMLVQHIDLGESKGHILNVPKEYIHIFIASYQHKGKVIAFASDGSQCTGPGTCIAPAPVWVLRVGKGELRSPSLPSSVAKVRVCVTIIARVIPGSRVAVTMQRTGGSERIDMGVLSIGSNNQAKWIARRFVKGTPRALRNKPLEVVVSTTQAASSPEHVMVQWVSSCNAEGDEDTYEQNPGDESYPTESGYNVLIKQPITQLHPVCMNGGHLNLMTNRCQCAPGFTGAVCDRGCGADSFGADCSGKCSHVFPGRGCRGLKLCAPGLQCDCAPGFGGTKCTEKCEPGRYGIGCRETCGQCRDGVACNPYTGRCQDGCRGALQPPYCKEECGHLKPASPFIIKGEDANAEEFPWHAAVYESKIRRKGDSEEFLEQICGATLVKPKLLISAAHCFYSEDEQTIKPAEKYKVALGKTYRGWDDPDENPPERVQRRDVYWIYLTDSYRGDFGGFADDIALVELVDPVLTTNYVAPICLDWIGGFDSVLDSTSSGSVVGWGRTEHGNSSRQLKLATLSYIGSVECLDRVTEKAFGKYINKDKFCAGDFNGNAVGTGDSGGGLLFKNHDQEGAWFLRGIVSVGATSHNNFAVYTNVTSYRDWLTNWRDLIDIRSAALDALHIPQ